jgi:gamma-glutamyl:cysteine ligase YbdK (ATP-grasp superfamily)
VIERRFGESTHFSVGIEEELFVIEPATLEPAPFPEEGFDGVRVKPELFTTQVELTTGVCGSAREALAASGTWPLADSGAQPVTDDPALRAFVE